MDYKVCDSAQSLAVGAYSAVVGQLNVYQVSTYCQHRYVLTFGVLVTNCVAYDGAPGSPIAELPLQLSKAHYIELIDSFIELMQNLFRVIKGKREHRGARSHRGAGTDASRPWRFQPLILIDA
jgi:hypothetical protein